MTIRRTRRRAHSTTSLSWTLSGVLLTATLLTPPALAQEGGPPDGGDATAADALGPDQAVGHRFEIKPDALPEPRPGESVSNSSVTVERENRAPQVPAGFKVNLFAEGLAHPRQLAVLPDGGVLVAEQDTGEITWLRDADGDGVADARATVVTGMEEPYGLALRENGDLYVADSRGIFRAEGAEAVLTTEAGPGEEPLQMTAMTEMGVFGEPGGHSTRSLAIDPDTGKMYSGVGSLTNVSVEEEPRATVQVFDPDGSGQRTFASGTRNPVGIGFNPTTGKLWVTVQERDGLGDRLVPDYFTEVEEGEFFGWPYRFIGSHPQPGLEAEAPDGLPEAQVPSLLLEAHSSAMDFVFYTGEQFPQEYRGDAFLALRGSWNRGEPTGYKVVHADFENGQPVGRYENFMTGFWVGGDGPAEVWGRPATIAQTPDGALLVGDDTGGTIWRVTYEGDTSSREAGLRRFD